MAETPTENNEVFTSFSNPNYQLNTEDALNSNTAPPQYYEDKTLYDNPDEDIISAATKKTVASSRRKKYAQMDLNTMGITVSPTRTDDVHVSSPDSALSPSSEGTLSVSSAVCSTVTSPSAASTGILEVEHTEVDDDINPYAETRSSGFLGYYASLEISAAQSQQDGGTGEAKEEEEQKKRTETTEEKQDSFDDKTKDINSPDSNDSGIQPDVQHIHGPLNDDIYALPNKQIKDKGKSEAGDQASPAEEPVYAEVDKSKKAVKAPSATSSPEAESAVEEQLPPGWQRCEDEDGTGAYYWHIKSGTIQREPPPPVPAGRPTDVQRSLSNTSSQSEKSVSDSPSNDTPPAAPEPRKERDTIERAEETSDADRPIRFAVRSLGWVRIAEEDLTPERSSKAVNKCIVDLSLGRNDINDVVGRWGDGKDLYMDLDNETLTLIDPQDMSVLNVQPIQSIRVWGVGRDNGRDFAYVARDRITRKHMCHVFRCDTPARQIANTLHDICRRIMMERSVQQALQENPSTSPRATASRPNHLPNLEKAGEGSENVSSSLYRGPMFPTPMEEPKKVLRCHYLGTARVPTPTGVEMINNAMDKMYTQVPPEKWVFVSVAVAPSTITITEHKQPDNVLAESRVRFLSFMGIARKNVKMCSFIVHGAQDQFIAHVFHCEPSAGALCKTIEAACKLRYQKCLDAHPPTPTQKNGGGQSGKTLSNTFTSLKQGVSKGVHNVFSKLNFKRK